jgi:omega-6 fatty acid desaturase (delta-12 desaturase)
VTGILAGVVVPLLAFNYFIALFIYLHHTELLVHDILIHVPHHVDPRIPFYRLKRAYIDLQRDYGAYLHEYRFRWSTVRRIFRRCQLYDFEEQVWYTYREAARREASRPGAR